MDEDRNYIRPPPGYECIVGDGKFLFNPFILKYNLIFSLLDKMDTNNLKDYMNMSELNVEHDKFGQCFDEDSFEKNFVLQITENQIEFIKSNNLLV